MQNWAIIAAVIFAIIFTWRMPYGADLRPVVQFGMPWLDCIKAWLPEGVLLGMVAFFSHRIRDSARFPGDSPSFDAFLAFLIYMALWLIIWGLPFSLRD